MFKLGKHTITTWSQDITDDPDHMTFKIEYNTYRVTMIEFCSIEALHDVSESINRMQWLKEFQAIETTQYQTVMAHLRFWHEQLIEDVDKIIAKLNLD